MAAGHVGAVYVTKTRRKQGRRSRRSSLRSQNKEERRVPVTEKLSTFPKQDGSKATGHIENVLCI
jgi:hypothetical protein